MAKGTGISATFSDGTTIARVTKRTYTHAFQVKATRSDADAESWKASDGTPRKHATFTGFGRLLRARPKGRRLLHGREAWMGARAI